MADVNAMTYRIPPPLDAAVKATLDDWGSGDKVRRLWNRDATLWTGDAENQWLDWLDIVEQQQGKRELFDGMADHLQRSGFTDAVLLGMGGSSLAPEVLSMTLGPVTCGLKLHVLDSTDPAQVRAIERAVDVPRTLFIVSSKSGTTLEPNIFKDYFFDRANRNGAQFVAITDPGSKLEEVARGDGVRAIYAGVKGIGGRYSALSNFGMVPAATMGWNVPRLLDNTAEMVAACGPDSAPADNPGVTLGAILGTLAKCGRDKVTLIASPGIADLGAWLEQLLAESTGKLGKGLIPVDLEPLGAPDVYGDDRVFAYLRLAGGADANQDRAIDAIEAAGQPVVRIDVSNTYAIGQELFRWEIATAVAGSIIGINAFDQPDVEASKIETRKLTSEYETSGHLPPEAPILEGNSLRLYADERNATELARLAGERSVSAYVRAHLGRLNAGDYCALLAYVERNAAHGAPLQAMRTIVRDKRRVATCVGFGPRFLHSTGQAYKGGPNSGVFLQITCDDAQDLQIPGHRFTFGVVKAAQARGDFTVLAERGRRALRVHLGADVAAGLAELERLVRETLREA